MNEAPRIRVCPEDFVVDELPLYPCSGEGEHTFVRVEKRLRTTEQVARMLAREAGVRPRDVGYAGRKDRNAVTRQWLSVPGLEPDQALRLELPGVRVLEASRHGNKLRTGHLAGNVFAIRVRGVSTALAEQAERRGLDGMHCWNPSLSCQRQQAERRRLLRRAARGTRAIQHFLRFPK